MKEFWYTPSDFAPSYFVRVVGEYITLLKMQDVWPGYEPHKDIEVTAQFRAYIQSQKEKVLKVAAYHPTIDQPKEK